MSAKVEWNRNDPTEDGVYVVQLIDNRVVYAQWDIKSRTWYSMNYRRLEHCDIVSWIDAPTPIPDALYRERQKELMNRRRLGFCGK